MIGCTAATPTSASVPATVAAAGSGSSTPPPGATAAHFRLGRTSRRSSSSGASCSSSSSNGGVATGITSKRKKRRRHSTFSSGIASGSDEEAERTARPTFRLRLGSYVSDFRLGGRSTRSHSPSSPLFQRPPSPSGAVRQRHQLRIRTTAAPSIQEGGITAATTTVVPHQPQQQSQQVLKEVTEDVEMDLDVQSTFQAMQVDSPTASPSPTVHHPFFSTSSARSRPSPSPIPTNLLSPLVTETRYPRSPSPLSPTAASASLPSISIVAHTSTSAVSPAVFPSPTFLAARRNSRHSLSIHTQHQQSHSPASPSPLARSVEFRSNHQYTPHPHQFQQSAFISQQHHQHHVNSTSSSRFQPSFQAPSQLDIRSPKSRSASTPPSPIASTSEEQVKGAVIPASPVRRHSDGRPSPFRKHAP
ncbi:uncharacterized protein UTRI_00251 [Ustilago trichophora]|uniref:Uncharacterized protein n=1 Tax=Ustilago trichophora TaxID=86804 RepID=A0A5C3DQW7_9BASI|nr:uncharacterized protein UTRI_00251 [Ustilago trichophora]